MRRSGSITWRTVAVCAAALTSMLVDPSIAQEPPINPPPQLTPSETLPLLTNAVQVHRLGRADAARGYPVVIRGVVTCSLPWLDAAVIQDATRGIYIRQLGAALGGVPKPGDSIEV